MDATVPDVPDAALRDDADAVLAYATSGRPLDPAVARRVHERARAITEQLRRRHGIFDLGVPAIRELRDG